LRLTTPRAFLTVAGVLGLSCSRGTSGTTKEDPEVVENERELLERPEAINMPVFGGRCRDFFAMGVSRGMSAFSSEGGTVALRVLGFLRVEKISTRESKRTCSTAASLLVTILRAVDGGGGEPFSLRRCVFAGVGGTISLAVEGRGNFVVASFRERLAVSRSRRGPSTGPDACLVRFLRSVAGACTLEFDSARPEGDPDGLLGRSFS
jgi:hypothetical protein